MTRFQRWVLRWVERWCGVYREGIRFPARLRDEPMNFAAAMPRASVEDWVAFTALFSEACYEQAYARGVEWVERTWDPSSVDPERMLGVDALAECQRRNVEWAGLDLKRIVADPPPAPGPFQEGFLTLGRGGKVLLLVADRERERLERERLGL